MPTKPMSTSTADVAVVAAQPVVQHSRIRALWGLTKRKPLGAAAASILPAPRVHGDFRGCPGTL